MSQIAKLTMAGSRGSDDLSTPKEAFTPILDCLPPRYTYWECAAGEGLLAAHMQEAGLKVIATDLTRDHGYGTLDFLKEEPTFKYDFIITNPPFSMKRDFVLRAFDLGRRFAMLLPIQAIGNKWLQRELEKERARTYSLCLLDKRIDFVGKKAPWFNVFWLIYGVEYLNTIEFRHVGG